MSEEADLSLAVLQVDQKNKCIWRGQQDHPLKPRAFAVLRYLMECPGRLVTRNELFKQLWPEPIPDERDAVLTVNMGEIRKALGDNAQRPQFIETVRGKGFRFIGKVSRDRSQLTGKNGVLPRATVHTEGFVGREAELTQLHGLLEHAQRGARQLVCVTGEPGVGKTTLVNVFLEQIMAQEDVWIGHGQCIEHYGPSEPYLPVLDALGQLCRGPGGQRFQELL